MMLDEQPKDSGGTAVPEFSIIITCYNEEQSIEEFYRRLKLTLEGMGRTHEIIFVNDASSDQTLSKLEGFFEEGKHVTNVIDFFWNSGRAAALTAGIVHARGTHFIFIDSDLQLDCEELPRLVEEFDKGNDLVSGYRGSRHDSLLRKFFSFIVNRLLRSFSQEGFRDFGCTFKVVDGRLIRGFEWGPFKPFRPAMIVARVRKCAEIPVTHHPRRFGGSSWTFVKLIIYGLENFFSLLPRPFFALGLGIAVVALLFLVPVLGGWDRPFSCLARSNGQLFSLLVFSFLAIVAVLAALTEFVIQNYAAFQRHPAYIIRKIHRR